MDVKERWRGKKCGHPCLAWACCQKKQSHRTRPFFIE